MPTSLHHAYFNSTAQIDLFNVTHDVKKALVTSGAKDGLATVFVPQGCAGVVVLENDPALQQDLKKLISMFVPEPVGTKPSRKSGTGPNALHLRGALLGNSVSIPVSDGKLVLGAWQEVIVFDFDSRVSRREVIIQILGDAPPAG